MKGEKDEMSGTMKAARLHEIEKPIRVDEIPIPEIGPNDALVKIKAAYINGGDLVLFHGLLPPGKLPMIMLHEMAGIVEEVGERVIDFKKGDRVAIDPSITCERSDCEYCRTDLSTYCPYFGVMGMCSMDYSTEYGTKIWEPYADGGFAEYLRAPANNLIPLPDNISYETAARVLEMGIGYRACLKAQIMPGDTVIVDAATGNSGSCALKTALLFNPAKVIAVGRSKKKLEMVKSWAPDIIETISSAKQNVNVYEQIMEITKGRGADRLIDYSPPGSGRIFEDCIRSLRKCGHAVIVGTARESLQLMLWHFMNTGITVTGCRSCPRSDLAETIKLTSEGKLDWSGLITHRFPISQANEMFEILDKRIGDPMWVLGLPQEA
jgi:alcohol dehydrogenase